MAGKSRSGALGVSRKTFQRNQHQRNTDHQRHYLGDGHTEPDALLADDGGEQKHGNQHEDYASTKGDDHRLQRPLDGGMEAAGHNVDERNQIMQRDVGGGHDGHCL